MLQPLAFEFLHVKSTEYAPFRQRMRQAYSRVWYVQNINAITFYVYKRLQDTDENLFRPGAWRASALVERISVTAAHLLRWHPLTLYRFCSEHFCLSTPFYKSFATCKQGFDALSCVTLQS